LGRDGAGQGGAHPCKRCTARREWRRQCSWTCARRTRRQSRRPRGRGWNGSEPSPCRGKQGGHGGKGRSCLGPCGGANRLDARHTGSTFCCCKCARGLSRARGRGGSWWRSEFSHGRCHKFSSGGGQRRGQVCCSWAAPKAGFQGGQAVKFSKVLFRELS